MRNIALYANGMRIADSDGNPVPIGARPVVRWREKVSFVVRLPDDVPFTSGNYRYAFDYDRDFLDTSPCNAGECTLADGAIVFEVVFSSLRQAEATNGRLKPIPFFIQVSILGDNYSEYILLDAIWVDGCVWDGRIPPAPEAPNYYTKTEVDEIAESKLDAPEEAGKPGYVLGLAEDGSTAWIPKGGGGGDVTWDDIQDKPNFATVATSGSYNDLSDKPAIPTRLSDLASDTTHRTVTDAEKSAWDAKSDFSGSYNDLSNKPTIPPAQVQSDWNETDTESKAYIQNKPALSTVATSGSYNDLSNKPTIPTRLSDLAPDTTHRTVTDAEKSAWDAKSDFSGSYNDLSNKPNLAAVATSGNYNDLSNKPTIPSEQIQADWNQSNTSAKDYIKNKPTIPPAQVQSDWNETNTENKAYIQNKPTIPAVPSAATNSQIDSRSASQDIRPSNLDYAVRSVLPNVTVIPAATTAYTLLDASATTNNHSAHYTHAPTGIPTYTLPAVTNTAVAHEILLDVDFTTVQTCSFLDSNGYTLSPQKQIAILAGDRYRFICIYEYGTWLIYPLLMQATTITPTTPVSITGDTGTALSVQLSASAGNSGALTYTATGLPAGVTCSASGLISGTPTTAGSCTATVTVSNPYARPATIVVNFTIAQGSSVPQSITVGGTDAGAYAGTYTLTADTMNDRPIWHNASNNKNVWAIENGMDNGYFAWVFGGTPLQMSGGDTMMFYEFCTWDVNGLSTLSESPDQATTTWCSMGNTLTSEQFSVTA